ncbi:hypothetical protein B0T10DRAFT_547220 [Thelonectria olida]|uniref:Autophagy-related protein n=1 Tax=Thelonectria olida TaxID=1576542 RepID=A0A9P8W8D1_9HYPO|nr:hypothetical protein B0T10DRAFT_547220 [Thelonectria olida]
MAEHPGTVDNPSEEGLTDHGNVCDFGPVIPRRHFLLVNSLNTTVTVIGTLQNSLAAYDTLHLTYLLIADCSSGKRDEVTAYERASNYTRTILNLTTICIVLLGGWGMIGIWTNRFGFHYLWEV